MSKGKLEYLDSEEDIKVNSRWGNSLYTAKENTRTNLEPDFLFLVHRKSEYLEILTCPAFLECLKMETKVKMWSI